MTGTLRLRTEDARVVDRGWRSPGGGALNRWNSSVPRQFAVWPAERRLNSSMSDRVRYRARGLRTGFSVAVPSRWLFKTAMDGRRVPLKEATINGPRSRIWTLEAKDCAEFSAHHMARIGIDHAFFPYRRVRLRPAGSFLLASLEGEGRMWLEGRWQTVEPGRLCLAPPRILNALSTVPERPWVFAWVRYDEPPWVKPLVGASSPLWAKDGAEQLGRAIAGLRTAWNTERDPAEVHHWVSLVQRLCRRCARPWQSGSRVGAIWESVVNDLTYDWKLSTLAAQCHVSAEHLRRLCLRELGRTPMEHVTYIRIQRAQELLESTDDKLESVAAQVGYRSSDVFTRAFTRCVGMPPSRYRERSTLGNAEKARRRED